MGVFDHHFLPERVYLLIGGWLKTTTTTMMDDDNGDGFFVSFFLSSGGVNGGFYQLQSRLAGRRTGKSYSHHHVH